MITEQKVACFLATGRHLSFTNAAENLYMSRQAVSRQVAELEQDLESQLFIRTSGKIGFTQVGEVYFNYFSKLTDQWAEIQQEVQEIKAANNTMIRIGYLSDLNISVEIQHIMDISRAELPGTKILLERWDLCDLYDLLLQKKLDIILTYDAEYYGRNKTQQVNIGTAHPVLVFSRDHPLANENIRFRDFEQELFLSTWKSKTDSIEVAEQNVIARCAMVGLNISRVQILPNPESLQTALEFCDGVTFTSDFGQLKQNSKLMTIPVHGYDGKDIISMWRKNENSSAVLHVVEKLSSLKIGH